MVPKARQVHQNHGEDVGNMPVHVVLLNYKSVIKRGY